MVHDDDFDFEPQSLLQNRANIQNNVLTKRKEQLKDWEVSEVNKMTAARKPANQAKVKFQDSDIFLSACVSGDEDEVEDLLDNGANINVSTIDGVTALHQAVIDDNLDMVRFLVEHGADINAQDNEGWTPLHAAVCCSSLPIAKFLCEKGADLTLTNSDKELAVDLAESDAVRDYLDAQIRAKQVDVDDCREREFQLMTRDCAEWVRAGHYLDRPHPRTGATALHVAASKGYNQLIGMLIHAGAEVNARDNEGWTPLHAAAHWSEKDACRILMENGASTDAETYSGQNVLMVADKAIVDYLTELQESFRELRTVALAQQQQKDHHHNQQETVGEASRESSVSKSSSASGISGSSGIISTSSSASSSSGSGSGATTSSGEDQAANGYCAVASASFTMPVVKTGDATATTTTGTPMISSNATKTDTTHVTLRGVSGTAAVSKKLSNGTGDAEVDQEEEAEEEEEYTEEMEVEYDDEDAGQEAEMEEEEADEEEELSADTAVTSSANSKTTSSGCPNYALGVLKSGRSASQPIAGRETTANNVIDRKYVLNGKGGTTARRLAAGDRQPSVASSTASAGSVDDECSEEMATGSQVSSIATTSRSVTPKDHYGSDSNVECPVDSSNVSTRRHQHHPHYLQKLPSAVDIHQQQQHQRDGWSSERVVKSEAPLSLSSSSTSAAVPLMDERRPFTAPSGAKRAELATLISTRFGSTSSVSDATATTTASSSLFSSSSSATAALKRNNTAFAEVTPITHSPMTARSTAAPMTGINRVQLPPWITDAESAKASTNNNGNGSSSLENRLLKPTIATSAKMSAKVPPCVPPVMPGGNVVSMNPNPGPAMTASIYGALPPLTAARGQYAPYSAGSGQMAPSAVVGKSSGGGGGSGVSSQTPPTQPSSNRESERKAKSRLQRHSRRSTQGVTLEQVGEAARYISNSGASSGEENADRSRNVTLVGQRKISGESAISSEKFSADRQLEDRRLPPTSSSSASLVGRGDSSAVPFPKWRSHVTSASSMTADDNLSDLAGSKPPTFASSSGPTVSAYFKLPPHNFVSASSSSRSTSASLNTPSGSKSPTPGVLSSTTTSSATASSATRANRRSQVVRGSRRGTGPVDVEAITAAAASSAARKTSATDDAAAKATTRLSVGKSKPDVDEEASVQAESTYKLMYEKEQEANERLQQRVDDLTRQLARQAIPNGGIVPRSGATTAAQMDDQERRAFERRIAALEYEHEKSKQLQSDYEKLKDENMALIRVLRKLSK